MPTLHPLRIALVGFLLASAAHAAPIVFQNGVSPGTSDAYYFGPGTEIGNVFTTTASGTVSSITFAVWNAVGATPVEYSGSWALQSRDGGPINLSDTFISSAITGSGQGIALNSGSFGPDDGLYDIRLVTFDVSSFALPVGSYILALTGVTGDAGDSFWGVASDPSPGVTATVLPFPSLPSTNFFVLAGPEDASGAPELNPASASTALGFCCIGLALLQRRKTRARWS
ncbi:hypothetical protein ABS71_12205 [bacterium SCN 62-11]|nr:hypothetical protein [Candidatus Eremiobacteraeota bacterium]ODT65419.1 MAG: hypothetical protein ABS71_12205 [bacterium SCN 62-11]